MKNDPVMIVLTEQEYEWLLTTMGFTLGAVVDVAQPRDLRERILISNFINAANAVGRNAPKGKFKPYAIPEPELIMTVRQFQKRISEDLPGKKGKQ